MNDAVIVCTWMEPDLPNPSVVYSAHSPLWWWFAGRRYSGDDSSPWAWFTRDLDLDALWEVEERLPDELWQVYLGTLCGWCNPYDGDSWDFSDTRMIAHATPEQKIAALAAILRPLVEGQESR